MPSAFLINYYKWKVVIMMNEKISQYLDGLFAPYEDTHTVEDLKEEILHNLQEKFRDLKEQGYDDETAYQITVDSLGDITEIMDSISAKTKELFDVVRRDFTATDLRNSDLKRIRFHDGKFYASDLKGSDFSGSEMAHSSFNSSDLKASNFSGCDLTDSIFRYSDLRGVRFDGTNLSGVKFIMSMLKEASFNSCILDNTNFKASELSGVHFDDLTLTGTIFDKAGLTETSFKNANLRNVSFKNTDVKNAIFDGASMDKLTYALLKGSKADLANVTVI